MKMIMRHWEQWKDCGQQKNRDILNNKYIYVLDVYVLGVYVLDGCKRNCKTLKQDDKK